MRDAMKAADAAGRFRRIGFDPISLRSEMRCRGGAAERAPSDNIMRVKAGLEELRDARNTAAALAGIH